MQDYYNIDYFMITPEYIKDLKFVPESNVSLECVNLIGMKRCKIPMEHFEDKSSGYYPTYHLNHLNEYSIDYELDPLKVDLPSENEVILRIKFEDNNQEIKMGLEGKIYFVTNYDDIKKNIFNASDIEDVARFTTNITNVNRQVNITTNCRLWKPYGDKLRVFCELNESELDYGKNNISFVNVKFSYHNYTVYVLSKDYFNVRKYRENIPFLYAEKQEINIEEGFNQYYLYFRQDSRDSEFLYKNSLYIFQGNSFIILDNCDQKDEKELVCKISKDKLEENLIIYEENKFNLAIMHEHLGSFVCDNVLDIKINYLPTKKEDIYVELTSLLTNTSESGVVAAYETNVSYLPNLLTDAFEMPFFDLLNDKYTEGLCYFKKTSNKSMLFLCDIIGEGYFYILETENLTILNDINYKYNFIINPIEIFGIIKVKGHGTYIFLTYPSLLNFTIEDSLTIKYIMSHPERARKIKLNPDSPTELNCSMADDIQTCTVPLSHFLNKDSGYYYTYHLNHLDYSSIYYASTPFNVIVRDEHTLVMRITKENNFLIRLGIKGTMVFITDYNDKERNIFNISDIEEKTQFNAEAYSSYGLTFNLTCRLWKPLNDNINLFCNLKDLDYLPFNRTLTLSLIELKYKDYTIVIKSEELEAVQYDYRIPFIYANPQEINFEEGKDLYEFKFMADSYKKEDRIYLSNGNTSYIALDNCNLNKKELTCILDKYTLDENLVIDSRTYQLGFMSENMGAKIFEKVYNIDIKIEIKDKLNIFVKILKPLSTIIPQRSCLAYDVKYNEKKITNLLTTNFTMTFIGNHSANYTQQCYFKKVDGQDLRLLCDLPYYFFDDFIYLKSITEDIAINNIHHKYNFILIPFDSEEKIWFTEPSTQVYLTYPHLLNLTLESDLNISLIMKNTDSVTSIKLNPNSTELTCMNSYNLKECKVPYEHFLNNEAGYYFIYYNNNYTFYDASPIYVQLPPKNSIFLRIKKYDNYKGILIGNKGGLYFNTDYDDSKTNIFDKFEIEEKTMFNTTIFDQESNEYDVECHLWKKGNNKISVFCDLNEELKYETQEIKLNIVSLKYNDYNIIINHKEFINVTKLEHNIPFLYANEQTINIDEEKNAYAIKFKYKYYNNDILYLYGNYSNYASLPNCEINQTNKEIICQISKEKLEEILIEYNDSFKLGSMNDYYGLLDFNYVSNINVIYAKYANPSLKEDINVTLTKIIEYYSEVDDYLYIETDVKSFPNINTLSFGEGVCSFKKVTNKPLMIICKPEYENIYHFDNSSEVLPFKKVHYKYNFFLTIDITGDISVKEKGTIVNLVYPEELDLVKENTTIIRYIMPNPQLAKNIKLNKDSDSYLECENLPGMKKCLVPLSHFGTLETGSFDTHHLDHLGNYSTYYELPSVKINLPNVNLVILDEYNYDLINVGINGTLYFFSDYNDEEKNIFDPIDIEEKTIFETNVYFWNNNSYNLICRLWKPINDNIRIFCDVGQKMETGFIYFNSIHFKYGNYTINIIDQTNYLAVRYYDTEFPFLYSDKQIINLDEGNDIYEFKFKVGKYNNEIMVANTIYESVALEKCNIIDKNMICQITKEKFEEVFYENNIALSVYAYVDPYEFISMTTISDIIISKTEIIKETIYIGITDLLETKYYTNDILAYETNVTNISNVITATFDLLFNETEFICFFKKAVEKPLLLLCSTDNVGNYSLGEIKEEIEFDEIHALYNFVILPVVNYNEFVIEDNDTDIIVVSYPSEILDFNLNDDLIINYFIYRPEKVKGIKLNQDSNTYLECEDSKSGILKKCIVPKSHFEIKPSGYYYTSQSKFLNKDSIIYSTSPLKVILPIENELILKLKQKDNDNENIIGDRGTIYFVTDYNDNRLNIFNISDIEEKTEFITKIFDDLDNEYDVKCRLWKPNDNNIRLFCTLNQSLINEDNNINIIKTTFEYDNKYNITIISELENIKVHQINGSSSFIYSDIQTIYLTNNTDSYELQFKADSYNGELLELFDSYFNEIILDECSMRKNRDLICTIKRQQLEEILAYNDEIFNLGILYNQYGTYYYTDNVLGIKFYYINVEKKDIYVNINKLMENISEKNHLIAYETNVSDINNVITETFKLTFNSNSQAVCFFKKSENTNLLLLCRLVYEGRYSLKPTSEQIELNDINILYNFIILPISSDEAFNITSEYNTFIFSSYPREIDLSNSTSRLISLTLPINNLNMKIKLNPEGDDLKCENLLGLLNCIIPLSHFDYEETGYYNLYYTNSRGDLSIYYEVTPFKVILPERKILKLRITEEDNLSIQHIGQKGSLYFITNYNDNETNIFNSSDIEEMTKFTSTITDEEKNSYNVNCRLWKPRNKKLVVLCNLEENLKKPDHSKIKLNTFKFTYNGYNISIVSETYVKVFQHNFNIQFIYSDKQYINLNNYTEIYELKFKYDSYNADELLYIYNQEFNYKILEDCETKEKEIICRMTKEQIESMLINEENKPFKLGATNENYGLIIFDLVLDINIIYEKIEKEEIYINILNLLENRIDFRSTFAYNTNISEIDELQSNYFDFKTDSFTTQCFFKKNKINNLLFICLANEIGEMTIGKIDEEIVLDNLHYKYIFRIQPFENSEVFEVEGNGGYINLAHPEKMNFTEKDMFTLIYMMPYPFDMGNIKLNTDSDSYIKCEDLLGMKKCIVSLSHFKKAKSGYYYTHHLNHINNYTIDYEANPIQVILPPYENIIEIKLEDEYNRGNINIGKKGTLYFTTSYKDEEGIFDAEDIEENTVFETTLFDKQKNNYKVICRLWKPANETLRLFCDLNETLINNSTLIDLNPGSFTYKNNKVVIISYLTSLYLMQYDDNIPFLYSDKQIIKLDEENGDFYEIKFKIGNYNDEILFLVGESLNALVLDNPKKDGKYVSFQIPKEKIEEIFQTNYSSYLVFFYIDSIGIYEFDNIMDIYIMKNEIIKENIYIKITKLLEYNYRGYEFIAYETNVTTIDNIISKDFRFSFKGMDTGAICVFKKAEEKPLLFLCLAMEEGNFSLGEIETEIIYDDIHTKYNFIISPVNNDDIFHIKGNGYYIALNYPEILDFTLNDTLIVNYITEPDVFKGIKLNQEAEKSLECTYGKLMMNCIVPKSHFEKKPSGYYYTSHLNDFNENSIVYFTNPIKVILPVENELIIRLKQKDNDNENIIGEKGTIYFITDYNDNRLNIFNNSDIEEKTEFITKIFDDLDNEYDVKCRLWKPNDNNIRLFCTLNQSLINEDNNINIIKTTFEYDNKYNITIISELENIKVHQINGSSSFIYSDIQTIYLTNNTDSYELQFKADSYNGELLELFDSYFNEIILDECSMRKNRDLICTIKRQQLEEILAYNDEIFNLGILYNQYGTYYYTDNVLGIKFYYINVEKKDIYVNINKLMENISEKNHLIAYETNVSDINNVITETFKLTFNSNSQAVCFFKKSENTNLLLLCRLVYEGRYSLKPTSEQIELNDINILYNFIILPISSDEAFNITSEYNTFIFSSYPREIDLSNSTSRLISLTLPINNLNMKIKLNPEGDDLKCENLLGLLNCIIPLSHFDYEETGYYNLYYTNSRGDLSIYYEVTPFKVILPERKILKLRITEEDNLSIQHIGQKGSLYFITNYNDNETNIFNSSDIEEMTKFTSTITDEEKNSYNVNCRLWKPRNKKLVIICRLDESLKSEYQNITLSNVRLTYKEYNISIYSDTSISVNQVDYHIPFIYSDLQYIIFKNDTELYQLKFKYESYETSDILVLFGTQIHYTMFEKCEKKEEGELYCYVRKDRLESILVVDLEPFTIVNLNDNYGVVKFELVHDIGVYENLTEKENVYVNITKLLKNVSESISTVAYETYTSINFTQNINTHVFLINFINVNNVSCYFKKNNIGGLLFICLIIGQGQTYLGINEEPIVLNNIHYKYNFIIQPFNNSELITISEMGSWNNYLYPEELDFTLHESIYIRYISYLPDSYNSIKLNPDSPSYLECEDISDISEDFIGIKKCIVPRSHFEGKESGYYYTYHLNHLNESSIFYDITPVKVILPGDDEIIIRIQQEDNKNTIHIGQKGTLYFFTDYNDTKNIFDPLDIEETTKFNSTISDEAQNNYKVNCRLFKPTGEQLAIICNLDESLKLGNHNITLNTIRFSYDNYTVTIFSETTVSVNQLEYNIPFLYSDKQYIEMKDDTKTYILEFKLESDNTNTNNTKSLLYIQGTQFDYGLLDNCHTNDTKLICIITKEKLESVLSYNNEIFTLHLMDDDIGTLKFGLVYDIIIKYEIPQKENIHVTITKLLNNVSEYLSPFAYETYTDVDLLQNINTHLFTIKFNNTDEGYCYFKKNSANNLLLLCNAQEQKDISLGKIEEPIILNDIHYRYNFIIQPVENYDIVTIKGIGTPVGLVYPETLNLTSKESLTIRYIMPSPFLSSGIKLNPDSSSFLECEDKPGLKICQVPLGHFSLKDTGYYYTYHLNYLNEYSIYYDAQPIKVIVPPNVEIKIEEDYNLSRILLGLKGTLYFKTSFNDNKNIFDIEDLEYKTYFKTNIIVEEKEKHIVYCSLWKPINDNLRLFCNINDTLPIGLSNIRLESGQFVYKDYTVIVNSNNAQFRINQINSTLPFLYHEKQTIDIVKDKDIYELKFKIGEYNDEILFFFKSPFSNIALEQCGIKNRFLFCQIKKDQIESIIPYNNIKDLYVCTYNKYFGLITFDNILEIEINHHDIVKQNVDVHITKLLNNYYKVFNFIAYETNVDSISNMVSDLFEMKTEEKPFPLQCFLKKEEGKNLLLLCVAFEEGNFTLGEIKQDIIINNMNIKYNFTIKPVKNDEIYIVKGIGGFIAITYPLELDFTKQDILTVDYYGQSPENITGFKLNPDAEELECVNEIQLKRCFVPLNHFEKKESGYYYTYSNNPLEESVINYEITPIKVILPKDNEYKIRIKEEYNKNTIELGHQGTLYFYTDYSDNEESIFDPSDIEEKTEFTSIITDGDKNSYNVNCRLWNPTHRQLIILCNLKDSLIQNKVNHITLNNTRLNYHEYNITIISETSVKVIQLNYTIPFIYSDIQNININDDTEIYELKFKYDSYNKEDILYLSGNVYTVLDNCEKKEKELICKISKEKLKSIIANETERFFLQVMYDVHGIIKFNLSYEINVNYEISQKENIIITITKLLSQVAESSSAIAYETNTNIDIIDNLRSNYFKMKFTHDEQNCYFKKNNANNILLICIIFGSGDTSLQKIENEIVLNDIHYKYNFVIQPVENNEIIKIGGELGTRIDLVYPEELDLTSEQSLKIRYVIGGSQIYRNIKLNPDSSSDLDCVDLHDMKICTVPTNHFVNKESGYYYTQHLNHLNEYSIFYDSNPLKVTLPKWRTNVEIGIEDKDNQNIIKIGQKGVLYFVTNFKDEENIFDEEYSFKGEFTDSYNNKYATDCLLWKPENENMRIMCQLNDNLPSAEQKVYMTNTSFDYKEDYIININYMAKDIRVKQLNSEVSFLYSNKKEIDIKDNEDNYKLVFKQLKYDNKPLYLYKNDVKLILLDDCKSENKEVNCNVKKNKILEILSFSGEQYYLVEKLENEGLYIMDSVLTMSFKYSIAQKDINIQIGNLLTPFVSKNEFIAYEVNITPDISDSLITDYFEIGKEKNSKMNCLFKKSLNQKLLLLCNALTEGKNSLGTIDAISLSDINIFYKFSIGQTENTNEFEISSNEGTKITSLTPLVLNFTEKDNYTIIYQTENPERLTGIKLNESSSSELECTNKPWYKECIVDKSHFTKSGNYYTYHSNHKGTKTIAFEAPMINVITKEVGPEPGPKPDPDPDPDPEPGPQGEDETNYGLIIGLSVGGIVLVGIIIFLIIYFLKKKNNNKDEKRQAFMSDQEEKEEEKVNNVVISDKVKEEIKQSEANEDRINN